MLPRNEKSLNGWGQFTFGMKFAEALTAYPGAVWDTDSLRKCRAGMPLLGCTLVSAEQSRFPLTAGVLLLPAFLFNQESKLATIRLRRILRGNIKPAQCKHEHSRLSDYLRAQWGSPVESSSVKRGMRKIVTAQGPALLNVTEDGAVVGRETFQVQPDGRKIILLSRYLGASEVATAICHLSIHYYGPERLQPPAEKRPHPLTNWY